MYARRPKFLAFVFGLDDAIERAATRSPALYRATRWSWLLLFAVLATNALRPSPETMGLVFRIAAPIGFIVWLSNLYNVRRYETTIIAAIVSVTIVFYSRERYGWEFVSFAFPTDGLSPIEVIYAKLQGVVVLTFPHFSRYSTVNGIPFSFQPEPGFPDLYFNLFIFVLNAFFWTSLVYMTNRIEQRTFAKSRIGKSGGNLSVNSVSSVAKSSS